MLAIAGIVTVATSRTIDRLEAAVTTLNDASSNFDDAIQTLRSQIYVSSLLLRDSFLDGSSVRDGDYFKRIEAYHRQSVAELGKLVRTAPQRHVDMVRSLSEEVRAYWTSVLPVVRGQLTGELGFEYIRTEILPRRQAVVTLAEELSDLQAADTRATHREMLQTIAGFRSRITQIRGLAIVLVAVIALLCVWRVYRLQRIAEIESGRRALAEEQLRALAQKLVHAHEEERRSLSRELHDHLGQMVTAIRFRLGNLEAENPAPSPTFRSNVAECRTLLEGTIDAIRQIAMGLRPAMLDDLGMIPAIEWYVREFSRRFDLPVSLTVEGANDVPEPHRTYVYRIVQEALTNCARHARATHVDVEIRQEKEQISVRVRDNGIGLDTAAGRRAGFGLTGMQERAHELRGGFEIYSPPSGGTAVEVTLPITAGAVHA